MESSITLRGLVMSKYKTIKSFAEEIGWSKSKASRILNGIQEPDAKDMIQLASFLKIDSVELFMQIFFGSSSIKWTDKQSAS